MSLPLEGIRLLDLTRAYAGTIGTQYLADLGADVIKVEAVSRPDIPTREMNLAELDPGGTPWERAAYFHRLNIGKRDITLDLSSEQGRNMFRGLVPECDVVAENYNPQTMRRFGLHYEALKELNPRIIMCSMSGFGASGPRANWSAYAGPMETMAGLTSVCGYDSGQTVGSATALGDWSLGTMGAISILSALHYRNRSGKGQYIDVAGRDAVLAALGEVMLDLSINGRVLKPRESRHPTMAPHDTFACKEENTWVAIAVRDQHGWKALVAVLGDPDWSRDPRFADQDARLEHPNEMRPLIEAWTSQRSKFEAADELLAAGIPAAAVLEPGETLYDPQLRAREYFEVIEHPLVGNRIFCNQVPARFSKAPRVPRAPSPMLGQHNHEVLGGLLNLTDVEIEALEDEGAIGTLPTRKSRRPPETTRDSIRKYGGSADDDYLEKLSEAYAMPIGPYQP
ncbi:MAG: CoA transferase [Kiritimatiellia bacterium]|jgi:crotonobetainyl-CoA:carnitine CoA-transferase CaiB-like acyl-CoA transferase|nr:CoA transferase [Pseudomonadales bacterium]MDP6469406.1 CoA transferase [Pseudomonadales bacterium]MDP6828974.1 CoA transferase [Pseudomonadales bacterium]MDP7024680.1 CoA transferase [Kiritimatiellia bacterium]|tara:strand:+ start:2956 stop:4317 length:1362 start_codon:yes stop_codon:yes gene_type:complete